MSRNPIHSPNAWAYVNSIEPGELSIDGMDLRAPEMTAGHIYEAESSDDRRIRDAHDLMREETKSSVLGESEF